MHRPQSRISLGTHRCRHTGDLEPATLSARDPSAVGTQRCREERLHEPRQQSAGTGHGHRPANLIADRPVAEARHQRPLFQHTLELSPDITIDHFVHPDRMGWISV